MSELRTVELGDVAVRDDAGSDGRTIEGYAYRWGELTRAGATAEYPGMREGFERGAFADAIAERSGRSWTHMDTHYTRGGRPVGAIVFREDDTGLAFSGRALTSQIATDYVEAVRSGMTDVSLEFIPGETKRHGRDTVMHTKVAKLAGLAGVPIGAYSGATVAVRQDGGQQVAEQEITVQDVERSAVTAGPVPLTEAQTIEIARRVAEDVSRSMAERSGGARHADPFAGVRNLGEAIIAASRGELPGNFMQLAAERALDDTVWTAGANAALLTGNLTVRNIAGIVSRGRPAITAFGGPAPVPTAASSITWPYFDGTLTDFFAAQSAQKAEITSAAMDIKLGTEALVTYAGGGDIALQLIRQGDPSTLEAFGRIVLTAMGVVTDTAFVTELESGSVTQDLAEALKAVDFTELVSHVITASLAVETATGAPAEFVLASTTAFTKAANLIAAASNQVVTNGTLDLAGLNVGIGNLRIIHVPSITAGKFIISNRLAARWHEAGPFQESAPDVPKLGRNVAWWVMGAGARYIPAGIIELYDVSP
jgi:HK97 family phage prohead protease